VTIPFAPPAAALLLAHQAAVARAAPWEVVLAGTLQAGNEMGRVGPRCTSRSRGDGQGVLSSCGANEETEIGREEVVDKG